MGYIEYRGELRSVIDASDEMSCTMAEDEIRTGLHFTNISYHP